MLHYVEQFQLNIFAILMLILILLIMQLSSRIEFYSKRLLRRVIIVNIIALIVEPATWIVDGNSATALYLSNYITNFLLVLLSPVLAGLSVSYIDYKVFGSRRRLKSRIHYMLPSVIVLSLLLINLFYPIFFSIGRENGTYSPGPHQWITYVVVTGIYLYVAGMIYTNRSRVNTRMLVYVLLFFSLPVIGMFIQMYNIHLFFAWSTASLGILIAFAMLETTSGEKDSLTGLYSRASYEEHVNYLIEEERTFSVMLIDLDGFKAINDTCGHHEGDQVLIEFARILTEVFRGEKMISRLAGDEFIIVIESANIDDKAVAEQIVELCRSSRYELINTLEFSYGTCPFDPSMTFDDLYIRVDNSMYANKHT